MAKPTTCKMLAVSILAAVVSAVWAQQTAESRRSAIVVCSSNGEEPWKLVAKGSLTRTKAGNKTTYLIEAGQHTFSWTSVVNSDKSITSTTPGSLIHAMVRAPAATKKDKFPRGPINIADTSGQSDLPFSQSLSVDGEIRERVGSMALVSIIGSTCPRP